MTSTTRNFTADGEIRSIRATNIVVGNVVATATIIAGGAGHHEVTMLFAAPIQGQTIDFRVDIFAGVGMIKASMLFMAIAFVISHLLK